MTSLPATDPSFPRSPDPGEGSGLCSSGLGSRLAGGFSSLAGSSMLRYVVRRVLWGALMLLIVSALTFIIFYAFPSADPAALRAGRQATPELIAQIRHSLGLDRPIYVQYWLFLKGLVLHFDLGYSYQNQVSVRSELFTRLPVTLSLTVGAFVIWMLVALPVGVISALRRRSLVDRATMGGALVAISAPVYWLGLLALFLFSNDIGVVHLLPGAGSYTPFSQDPYRWFTSLLMPWVVLAAGFAAFYARMVRGNLIDVMGEDYIRTARAKGLAERVVVRHHGLRAALTPIVTMAGLDIGVLLGGAVLTETVFNIPGVGRFAYDSIVNSDLPAIQGTVLFGAFFIVVANIVVDVLYAFLDPRVRY
jgi:peptide/nickel transport system permease protein